MNPQMWSDAFVERNAVDLAQLREVLEDSLANASNLERKKRPHPQPMQGAVISMDVRDRVLLSVGNPAAASGRFRFHAGPNRSVQVQERSSGTTLRVRKIMGNAAYQPFQPKPPVVHQPRLYDNAAGELDEGCVPFLVWSIDPSDLLGDCLVVVLADEKDLQRSPLVVCARTEIPQLASLPRDTVKQHVSVGDDDFGNLVAPRRPKRGAGGVNDAPPSV
ncbi:hypothetical protein [Streptomyces sp. NPDC004134]|uniref:hypothetical protein n=1 Tax=Streptomyces sp. NPDC004134 TaxID=3364691 RepID=UPI00367EB4C0